LQRIWSILALLLFCGPAGATSPAEQPYRIASYGRLVTDVYVNGQGPFTFLIDTASSRSLIFEHVRQKLGLARSQPEKLIVYGINDVAEALPVKPDRITVAGEEVKGLTIGVLPETSPTDPDGILGVDFLSHYFVVLDRQTMQLKLLPPGEDSARAYRGWSETQLTPRLLKKFPIRFWYLSTRFNDYTISTLFDLGAGTTMMNWHAAERLGVHKRSFTHFGPPPEELQDVLGKVSPALRIENVEVRLPGKTWDRQLVIVADAPVFNYFDLEDQAAAIVGPGLLRDTSLAIDFAGQRLYVGPTFDRPVSAGTIRRPVQVYVPDPKEDAYGHATSGNGSCEAQVFRC
jgi:predicted aspartyl protease